MAYEIYHRSTTRVDEAAVSIGPSGAMRLNAAASRLMQGAGVKAVLLLWDKHNRRIAFKAAPRSDRNAYAISTVRTYGSIRAKSFLAYIEWGIARRQMPPATWNEKEKMLEVRLPTMLAGAKRRETTVNA